MIKTALKACVIAYLFMFQTTLFAQKDTSDKTVVVIVPTNPSLSDGRKLEILPQISRNTQIDKPAFDYRTIEKFSNTDKHVSVLPPITYTSDKREILPNGYGYLGYGNLNAWNGNLYLANNEDINNAYGLRANHYSTDIPSSNKDFSRNEIGAFAKIFRGLNEFGVSFDYARHAYRFFNLPDSVENLERKDVTRFMEQWNFNAYFKTGDINNIAIKPYFRTDIDFERFNTTGFQYENSFKAKGHLRLEHESFLFPDVADMQPVDIELSINIDQFHLSPTNNFNRYFGWLNAFDQFKYPALNKDITVDVGIKSAVYADSLEPEFYFNPYVNIQFPVLGNDLILIGGVDGGYEKQGLRTLYSDNPFIQNEPLVENKFVNLKYFGGFSAKIAPGTSFLFEASSSQISNMIMYFGTDDPFRRFGVRYDNGRHALFKGQLNFNLGDKIWVNLIGAYNDYKMENEEEAWLMPDFEAKLRVNYNLAKKIFTRFDVLLLGNRSAIDENNAKQVLKPLADINLGLDYHFGKSLFAFMQLNNIAGTMYQRWYQFPVYGFNATAGIGMRF